MWIAGGPRGRVNAGGGVVRLPSVQLRRIRICGQGDCHGNLSDHSRMPGWSCETFFLPRFSKSWTLAIRYKSRGKPFGFPMT